MARVTINVHPVQDRLSWIVWQIGRYSRGVSRTYLHAAICIEAGGNRICYDLRDNGVSDIELPDPSVSYDFDVTAHEAMEMMDRVRFYRTAGYKVSLCTLLRAMVFPSEINWNICTSFVDFVFFGVVSTTSNRIDTFMERYAREKSWRIAK